MFALGILLWDECGQNRILWTPAAVDGLSARGKGIARTRTSTLVTYVWSRPLHHHPMPDSLVGTFAETSVIKIATHPDGERGSTRTAALKISKVCFLFWRAGFASFPTFCVVVYS